MIGENFNIGSIITFNYEEVYVYKILDIQSQDDEKAVAKITNISSGWDSFGYVTLYKERHHLWSLEGESLVKITNPNKKSHRLTTIFKD